MKHDNIVLILVHLLIGSLVVLVVTLSNQIPDRDLGTLLARLFGYTIVIFAVYVTIKMDYDLFMRGS